MKEQTLSKRKTDAEWYIYTLRSIQVPKVSKSLNFKANDRILWLFSEKKKEKQVVFKVKERD